MWPLWLIIIIFQTTSSCFICHTDQQHWPWCETHHMTHRLIALLLFVVFLGLGLGAGAGVGFVVPKAFVMAATCPLSRALTERLRWSSIVCLARDRLRMSAAFDFCTGTTYAKSHRLFLLVMHDWKKQQHKQNHREQNILSQTTVICQFPPNNKLFLCVILNIIN